jgi:hypothetical protein
MTRSRLSLQALGLWAIVLMTFATVAQAEKGAQWMVNGKNIENGTLKPLLQSTVESDMVFLFTLGGIAVKVLCKAMELVNFSLLAEGSLSEGKIKFSQCVTIVKESVVLPCLPNTGGAVDVIESSAGAGLFVLVGGVGMILFKPAKGEFFTVFKTSEECALGADIKIEGELVLKDCQNKFKEEATTHLLEADPSSTLKVGSKPATLEGSLNVKLVGEHSNLQWSGLPA